MMLLPDNYWDGLAIWVRLDRGEEGGWWCTFQNLDGLVGHNIKSGLAVSTASRYNFYFYTILAPLYSRCVFLLFVPIEGEQSV